MGEPPQGSGVFDQLDIVAVPGMGLYLSGPYPSRPAGAAMHTLLPALLEGSATTAIAFPASRGELGRREVSTFWWDAKYPAPWFLKLPRSISYLRLSYFWQSLRGGVRAGLSARLRIVSPAAEESSGGYALDQLISHACCSGVTLACRWWPWREWFSRWTGRSKPSSLPT